MEWDDWKNWTNLEWADWLEDLWSDDCDAHLLPKAAAALRNLHTENTALRVTEENLRQELQECQDQRRAAFRRIEELDAMRAQIGQGVPDGVLDALDNFEKKERSPFQAYLAAGLVNELRTALLASAHTAPQASVVQQEPPAWKHDCAVLLANDVELWIDACPHCGKPRHHPAPQQSKPQPLTDEPDWRHPKIQGLIGSEARLRIAIDLIWQILENPEQEFTASDMEYWDTIHDKLKESLSVTRAIEAQGVPVAWMMVNPTHLPHSKSLHWEPQNWHITWEAVPLYTHPAPQQKPLTDERIGTLSTDPVFSGMHPAYLRDCVRAVEAAHGIKE